MLINGERAAPVNDLSARPPESGRTICLRVAHFLRFRDGKIIENVSIVDSCDAAEQVLGSSRSVPDRQMAPRSNLIAI